MNQDTTRSSRALGSNYVLEREIGGGATGRVWRAVRRADGAAVAVKILRSEFAGDTDSVVRFLRQRTVLAEVAHPHLVRVHDLVAEGDMLAVVMDLVEGRDLRQVIRTGIDGVPLNQETTLTILAQVAQALAAVHAAGVVHRDVKPENVLIQRQGQISPPHGGGSHAEASVAGGPHAGVPHAGVPHAGVPHAMLTDFGLAKMLDSPVWTSASVLHGTPAYIAPEVVTGKPAGPEADVYALSIMAYELLAGQRPVQADNPAALLLAHLGAEVTRPPGLPDGLWRLISAGLSKEPEARPTAAEFAARVLDPGSKAGNESITASTMDAIRPAPVQPKPLKPKRRKRWMLWTAGALCLALGVGAGLWAGRPDNKDPKGQNQVSASAKPAMAPVPYPLAVTATSPRPGEIQLKYQDASNLPGFESYIIYRGEIVIQQVLLGQTTSYLYQTGDHGTEFCFTVVALLLTENPPLAPKSEPACTAADGKRKG